MAEQTITEPATEPAEGATDYKALYEAEKAAHEAAKAQARKWEGRAKENKDGATKASSLEEQIAKLTEEVGSITAERDRLAAEQERSTMVAKVAADSGLDPDIVNLFAAADEKGLAKAAELVKSKLRGYPITRDSGQQQVGKTHVSDNGVSAAVAGLFNRR